MKPIDANRERESRSNSRIPPSLLHDHEVESVSSPAHDLYDRLAERFSVLYRDGKERTNEAMEVAISRAKEELAAAGEFTQQQGDVLAAYLKRDLEQTGIELADLGRSAKEKLHPARLGAGAMSSLAAALEFAGDTFQEWAKRTDSALVYRTGEITGAGTLQCNACGGRMRFKRTGTVPPCPHCGQTTFKRGY